MYAVIETGGKQYRVELGTEIQVDRMDAEPGKSIQLERVLLVADGDEATIGTPLVDGALVKADVVRQDRGDKIVVFKYKPKARRRVKKGHRRDLTVLRIAEIAFAGKSAAEEAQAAEAEERRAREKAEKEAAAQAKRDQELAAKLAEEQAAAEAAAEAKAPAKGRTGRTSTKPAATKASATKASASKSSASKPADTKAAETPTKRKSRSRAKPAAAGEVSDESSKDE